MTRLPMMIYLNYLRVVKINKRMYRFCTSHENNGIMSFGIYHASAT